MPFRAPILATLALLSPAAGAAVFAGSSTSAKATGSHPVPAPSLFAFVTAPGGTHPDLQLRSPLTGARIKDLGPLGPRWDSDGFAFAPDGSSVVITRQNGRHGLQIVRVPTDGSPATPLAGGEQPAFSPDGSELAYAAGGFTSPSMAVRDGRSGATRKIDLRRLLGGYELLNGSIAWLGDGRTVAVLPSPPAEAAVLRPGRKPARGHPPAGSCAAAPRRTCLLLIDVPPPGEGSLSARRVLLTLPRGGFAATLFTDTRHPRAIDVREVGGGTAGERLVRASVADGAPAPRTLLAPADILIAAVDPTGTWILYLSGHNRPALWQARIRSGRLTARRRLIPDAWLQAAAW